MNRIPPRPRPARPAPASPPGARYRPGRRRAARLFALTAAALAMLAAASPPAGAQLFVDVTSAAGIPTTYSDRPGTFGHGAAAADYDNDGDIDVFLPNGPGSAHRLFQNQGNGTFTNVAAAAGLNDDSGGMAALWLDYDGDGLLDLLIATDCREGGCEVGDSVLRLFRQGPLGSFTETTGSGAGGDCAGGESGLADAASQYDGDEHRGGISAGDLNGDGLPDVYAGMWNGGHPGARLFLTDTGADCLYRNATATSNIADSGDQWQPVMHDFNNDGLLDIYVAIDFDPNRLYINQGDETFLNRAPSAGVNNSMNDMGVALGDYDHDGDFDIYITNIHVDNKHNILYRNDTVGSSMDFTDVSEALGVDDTDFGWGTTWLDGDNDGDLDLAVTNGFSNTADQSRYFCNDCDPPPLFADVSMTVGFDDTERGSALMAFDYDRDGDLDLLQTTVPPISSFKIFLYENRLGETLSPLGADANYLVVRPRMDGPNSHAIGAVVRARVGSDTQSRLITTATSFMGQEPAEAHFGLGTATVVDEVIVEWPDGTETRAFDVPAGQVLDLPGAVLELDPAAIDFGNAATGSMTHVELMLSNKSALTELDVTAMTLSDPVNFALDATGGAGRCGSETPTIAPLADCTVQLTYAPTSDAFHTATLTVASSDLVNPQQSVALAGCSALEDHKVVDDVEISATETYDACSTITVGPTGVVEVTATGRATFRARDGISVFQLEVAPGGEAVLLNPGG